MKLEQESIPCYVKHQFGTDCNKRVTNTNKRSFNF